MSYIKTVKRFSKYVADKVLGGETPSQTLVNNIVAKQDQTKLEDVIYFIEHQHPAPYKPSNLEGTPESERIF